MSLSDIVSHAGLAIFAEVGLLLFLGAFLIVAARILFEHRNEEMERAAALPLQDDGFSEKPVASKERGT